MQKQAFRTAAYSCNDGQGAHLRGDNLIEVEVLAEALEHGAPVRLAPPILQEVLQGADSPDRFRRWDRVLGELPMVIAPDMQCPTTASRWIQQRPQ